MTPTIQRSGAETPKPIDAATAEAPLPERKPARSGPVQRATSWWLTMLRKRAERMYDEKLRLDEPIVWESEAERQAAIAFFNAAFRAEESGLTQAHALADEVGRWDPDLAECLRLYGNEEGWHRELLTEFLAYLGGEVRPMGKVTGTFYRVYGRAKRLETIVLTNLMFETIGSTTYRLALRRATRRCGRCSPSSPGTSRSTCRSTSTSSARR